MLKLYSLPLVLLPRKLYNESIHILDILNAEFLKVDYYNEMVGCKEIFK